MNIIQFDFDFEPCSSNKLYSNIPGQARRFVSKEGKKFKADVLNSVLTQIRENDLSTIISAFVGKPLSVNVQVELPTWLLKNQKDIRQKDIENTSKALLDSLFESLRTVNEEFDDKYIWDLTLKKKVASNPKVIVRISEYIDEL